MRSLHATKLVTRSAINYLRSARQRTTPQGDWKRRSGKRGTRMHAFLVMFIKSKQIVKRITEVSFL